MIITAFVGYVLPWGQISYWGATVITNLVSSVPVVGSSLVIWLWGGFSVNERTLGLYFTIHYLLPHYILTSGALFQLDMVLLEHTYSYEEV